MLCNKKGSKAEIDVVGTFASAICGVDRFEDKNIFLRLFPKGDKSVMHKTERNYGIDLMRIICLLGIAMLHIMGHGGVLNSSKTHLHFSLA